MEAKTVGKLPSGWGRRPGSVLAEPAIFHHSCQDRSWPTRTAASEKLTQAGLFPAANELPFHCFLLESLMNTQNRTLVILAIAGVAMATLALTATTVNATPIAISNHSFESGSADWTQVGGGIKTPPEDNLGAAPDGSKVYFTWANAQNISRVLTDTLAANTT